MFLQFTYPKYLLNVWGTYYNKYSIPLHLVTNHARNIFLNQFCVVPIKTSFFTDPCMFLRCEQNCTFFIIYLEEVRAGVCRTCVETKLTATKKSATDGN